MPDYTIKSLFQGASDDVKELVQARWELLQLKATEKGANVAAKGMHGILIFGLLFLISVLVLIAGGLAFSLIFLESTETLVAIRGVLYGFLCMMGLLILLLIILLATKKGFQQRIEAKVINQTLDMLEEEEAKRVADRVLEPTSEYTSSDMNRSSSKMQ